MSDVGKTSTGSTAQPKAPVAAAQGTSPLPAAPPAPPPIPGETTSLSATRDLGGGLKFVSGVGGLPQDLRIPAYDRSGGQYSGYLGFEHAAEQETDLGQGFTAQTSVSSTLLHNFKKGEPTPLLEAKTALAGSVSRDVAGVTLSVGVGVDLGVEVSRRGLGGSAAPSVSAGAAFNLGRVHVDARLDAPVKGFKDNWAMNTAIGVPDSKYMPDLEIANGPNGLDRIGLSKSLKIRDGLSLEANVGLEAPLSKERNVSAGVSLRWTFGR